MGDPHVLWAASDGVRRLIKFDELRYSVRFGIDANKGAGRRLGLASAAATGGKGECRSDCSRDHYQGDRGAYH